MLSQRENVLHSTRREIMKRIALLGECMIELNGAPFGAWFKLTVVIH
ncbi:2-dehydro-3-deoxygluconate kinase [Vibrio ponticus]|nr:2-dehydro-3-deoxygluconate kinase [Vibrio ponticus]